MVGRLLLFWFGGHLNDIALSCSNLSVAFATNLSPNNINTSITGIFWYLHVAHQDYVGVEMVAVESHLCHHLNDLNYTSFLLYICMCLIQISQNVSAGVQGNTMAHVKKCSIKLQCGLLYTGNNFLHFRCTNVQHYHLHLFIHVQGT